MSKHLSGMRDSDPSPFPTLFIPIRRPPPTTMNNNTDPHFGIYVKGQLTKEVDGESVEQEDATPNPKTVNRFSKAIEPTLVKHETYPYRLYETQRRDIIRMVRKSKPEIKPGNVALKPVPNGFIGVLFNMSKGTDEPYLFSVTSLTGVLVRPSKDTDNALRMHQHLLDTENRVSKKLQMEETSRALEDFADRLSKAFPVAKEQKVKQAKPMPNTGAKIAGAGGKTRYNYGAQGKEKGQPGAASTKPKGAVPPAKPKGKPTPPGGAGGAAGDEVTPVPTPKPVVVPENLATMLHTTTEVIKKVAMRFLSQPKLGGKEGFVKFFQTKFGKLVKKHDITTQYLRMLFNTLTDPQQAAAPAAPAGVKR